MARRRPRVASMPRRARGLSALALAGAFLCLVVAVLAYRLGATRGPLPEASWTPAVSASALATGVGQATPGEMVEARIVRVVDGDTIEVEIGGREYTVRYIGINTPETKAPNRPVEPYGPEASAANEALVAGKVVYLAKDVSETDRYGRLLRYVWVDGIMVNEELVRRGYARASTYPPDVKNAERFLALEREAREAGRGLWALATPEPTPSPEPAGLCPQGCLTPPPECRIKGNITADGRKIYHLPDSPYYERTKILPEADERWFCNPAEAEGAGWQAAGG